MNAVEHIKQNTVAGRFLQTAQGQQILKQLCQNSDFAPHHVGVQVAADGSLAVTVPVGVGLLVPLDEVKRALAGHHICVPLEGVIDICTEFPVGMQVQTSHGEGVIVTSKKNRISVQLRTGGTVTFTEDEVLEGNVKRWDPSAS